MIRAGLFIGVDQTGGLQRLNDAARGAGRMHAWAVQQGMPDAKLITDAAGKVTPDQSRDQSPISTANPNAVSVETPRRQPSRVTTGVNCDSAAIAVIASSRRSRRCTQAIIASNVAS
jgi:hypothetical protein